MRKTYLSRAMTRAYSMDGPVGDPFNGPGRSPVGISRMPYTEYNEPVTAFFAVATAFETIAAIGAVVSVVGMVTGNSDLAKIGGVMGLVGGFGTMAQSGMFGGGMQEWAQGVNQSFGTSTASNISSAAVPTDAFANGEVVTQSIAGGAPAPGLIDVGSLNLEQLDTSGMLAPPDTGPIADTSGMAASDGAISAVEPSLQTGTSVSGPLDIAKAGEPINAMQASAQQGGNINAVAKAAGTGIDTGTSLFDKILKEKELAKMGLEFFAKGYQSQATKDKLASEMRMNDATADFRNEQIARSRGETANANAIPNVGSMSVTGAPIYKQDGPTARGVRYAGLIQTRSA